MSQSGAERRVKQALIDTDGLSPQGTAKAQEQSGAVYIAVPIELANHHQISQGAELERAYHPASSTLLVSLDGTSLFDF
jgi:hypothetical protein